MEPREHADELTRQRLRARARRSTPIRKRLVDKLLRRARELQAWTSSEPTRELAEVTQLADAGALVRDAIAALELAVELLAGEAAPGPSSALGLAGIPPTPARERLLTALRSPSAEVVKKSADELARELGRDKRSVKRDLDLLARASLVTHADGTWTTAR